MWKRTLENRVRLTPRADGEEEAEEAADRHSGTGRKEAEASENGCGEVFIHPSAEDYFENLRKKFRADDGGAIRPALSLKSDVREEENAAKANGTKSQTTPGLPFQGVVVFLNKKVEDQRELIRAVEKLGGKVRFQVRFFSFSNLNHLLLIFIQFFLCLFFFVRAALPRSNTLRLFRQTAGHQGSEKRQGVAPKVRGTGMDS